MKYAVAWHATTQYARDPIGGGSTIIDASDPDEAYRLGYQYARGRVDDDSPRANVTITDVTPLSDFNHGGPRHICNLLDKGCRDAS